MASSSDGDHHQLVQELAAGFELLMRQFDELGQNDSHMVKRLVGLEQVSVCSSGDPADGQVSRTNTCENDTSPELITTRVKEERSSAVAAAVRAWKRLTDTREVILPGYFEDLSNEYIPSGYPEVEAASQCQIPVGHPTISEDASGNAVCPFASMKLAPSMMQPGSRSQESVTNRPSSPPTPPLTRGHLDDDERSQGPPAKSILSPPSAVVSVSQCPIRMLDERPPEEIAEYFETHKHEIPRSHEVCVKRYQRNAEGIRQLDATYGNLVNMIQGLGIKHQPLLPAKEDGHHMALDEKSVNKVERWANAIKESPSVADREDDEEREGHFDRPLKDIRVGESPSRPWGISVPLPEVEPITQNSHHARYFRRDETKQEEQSNHASKDPKVSPSIPKTPGTDWQARTIFTGPVLIGYGPEQAAVLIKQLGFYGEKE